MVEVVAPDISDCDEALEQQNNFVYGEHKISMPHYANRHRKITLIQPEDFVYLETRLHTMVTRHHPKLVARYYGPYVVLQQIGAVTLKLQLTKQAQLLKEAAGNHLAEAECQQSYKRSLTSEHLKSLDNSIVNKIGEIIEQVLVQWQIKPPEEATWEDLSNFSI